MTSFCSFEYSGGFLLCEISQRNPFSQVQKTCIMHVEKCVICDLDFCHSTKLYDGAVHNRKHRKTYIGNCI